MVTPAKTIAAMAVGMDNVCALFEGGDETVCWGSG